MLATRPKAEINRRVRKVAEILQLSNLLERKLKALSGGQRQRVAIGRAIVRNPKIFLFDEPLSNLDAALRAQMRVDIAELHQKIGTTMVCVTHDQVEAMTMADQIVVLNAGRIEQVGNPLDPYRTPATPFVAGFIGSPKMNLFEGEVAARYGAEVFGVRPERIEISKQNGDWQGTLRHVEYHGSATMSFINVDGIGAVTVRSDGDHSFATGKTVHLALRDEQIHRFRNGQRI